MTYLIVSDFDGTLAGLCPDPAAVPVNHEACAALSSLAELADTDVVILSGRSLADLRSVCPLRAPVRLVGSHGAETEGRAVRAAGTPRLPELEALAEQTGAYVERKPFQLVFHVAALPEAQRAEALRLAREIDPGRLRVSEGKNILEFSASRITKGSWIEAERRRLGARKAIFMGDDTTDEDGFRALRPGDLGVKVGQGATAATQRIAFEDVTAFWEQLLSDLR